MREAIRDLIALNWRRVRRSWLFMVLMRPLLIVLITLNSLLTRERMSHENGLVVRGRVRIRDDVDLPENRFFEPGKEFKCRLRHASVSFLDDAALVVRAASIKFADAPINSPFDMLMNNGTATPFWNMDTFWQFMKARAKGGRSHLVEYFKRNPRCYMNVRDALRFDPDSFAHMRYHSQIPLEFVAGDGKRRYAKFRLVPADPDQPESGLPDEDMLQSPWFQEPVSNETRSRNYLKDEYRARLEKGPVEYRFQIQLLEWKDSDTREVELNSLYPWDEAEYPWRDLADVTITEALDPREGNLSLFSLRHLPRALRVVRAQGIEDGPSIDYLRMGGLWPRRARLMVNKIFGQKRPFPDERPVVDGEYADRATSTIVTDDVYMRPSLPQKDTSERQYVRLRHIELARGAYQYLHGYFRTEATEVGALWSIRPWYVRVFNIYEADPKARVTVPVPLPPFIRNLCDAERYSVYINGRLYKIIGASIVSSILSYFEEWLTRLKGLDIYKHLFVGYRDKPISVERWQLDEEFGRQRLDGLNPGMIRLFDHIPDKFPVTDKIVEGLLDPGETLASAIAKKRLYWCDYEILEGISVKEGRYLARPVALFYTGRDARFMPVAIQLCQSPEDGPIFTPKDQEWLWTAVKAYTASADAQVHEVIEHLLHGHLIVEVFDIAIHRTLPDAHPINKLLTPHLEYTMAVNESARAKMLAPAGPIDKTMAVGAKGAFELMGRAWWERWDFERHNIPHDLATRGVGDPETLPNYHWRDDALRLWHIIESYAREMVEHFYESDADVLGDWELQALHLELRGAMGGDVRGLPGGDGGFATREMLTEVVTRLIYAATGGHAAVNNGQYDYYGFIPNTPGAMYHPVPCDKSEVWDEQKLADAMPDFKPASIQILMVRLLSRRTEMPIGLFHTDFFAGTNEVWPIVNRFRRELYGLSQDIKRRNKGLVVPYTYLDPDQVACSITA